MTDFFKELKLEEIKIKEIPFSWNLDPKKIERINDSDLPQNQYFTHFIDEKDQVKKVSNVENILPQFRHF